MRQLHELHAFWQLDFGQVDGMAGFEINQIDFDELRQILRQAADIDFGQDVRDDAAYRF